MKNIYMTVIFALIATLPVQAADEGLYDPVAPAGSSFIRSVQVEASSAYRIADKSVKAEKKLEDGKFYSLIKNADSETLIEDKPPQSRAKAVISIYNFASQSPLSLKTADGKVAITEPAGYGEAKFRDINGTKVAIAVFEGDKKLSDIGEKSLQRGAGYTVFVSKKGDAPKAEFIEASVDTTK